jgi:AmmeMemoRadiSam system protein A
MSPLLNDDRRALLGIARRAVIEAVERQRLLEVASLVGALANHSGVFVTLRRRGRLRGCIGQVEAVESIGRAVARCAMAAALEDPRFDPVRPVELVELEIEISAISPLERISLEGIEIGRHGLMVTRGYQRGLLLPQVASEFRWTSERFLEETCVKGGMERQAWKDPAARIEAFTAEVFSEIDLRAEPRARAG